MAAFIVSALVGVLCVAIGICNCKGNISMLHSYHTKRVAEEDRLPLGKRVGIGTILMGVGIIANSALSAIGVLTETDLFTWVGMGIMGIFLLVGTVIALKAIAKYNKGIF